MDVTAKDVLDFWFGELDSEGNVVSDRSALWWKKSPETDATIRERFAQHVDRAERGERDAWATEAAGRLALIVGLDQFPRNMYRDTPRAFAFDERARQICLEGLEQKHDQQLPPIQRVFFYMPLEHAEDRALQQRCLELFTALRDEAPEAQRATFAGYVGYAERHKAIVDRFGRFPHRNAILDRPSTPEELEFLKQPGSSF